jgi:hypothetical protein
MSNENLEMYVVDTDNGCGVIKRGQQILVPYEELTFNKFIQHKIKWMNVISVEKFKELI